MKRIESATVWMGDKHDANMVGANMWMTVRIGDHEILVNVNRQEIQDALKDLENENETRLYPERTKEVK